MECTQRLDFDSSQSERICPEQIGFLGILGTKYPVKRGPNKIGRDPQTCSIVLNRNSISRQHAVINVLSGTEYMLMDLDSANKTKLNNKTLPAYIPAALSNGDTVQFGEVFGMFRLLEEDAELPCTQALELPDTQDVPDTPAAVRHVSRLQAAIVPESPEVSDRDDSFIMPSQPKSANVFKSPSNKYTKPSSKTISIQPVGSNKIDNVFWKSSKKSTSFNLNDSDSNLNESIPSDDIHGMETQAPYPNNESTNSIYSAETQVPPGSTSPSIHSVDTQLPALDHLPAVCKISDQHEMEIDICAVKTKNNENIFNADTQLVTGEKENVLAEPRITDDDYNIFNASTQFPVGELDDDKSVFNADTQLVTAEKEDDPDKPKTPDDDRIFTANTQLPEIQQNQSSGEEKSIFTADTQYPENGMSENDNIFTANTELITKNNEVNVSVELKSNTSKDRSDDVIIFDEVDSQSFLDDFQSQPILELDPKPVNIEDDIPLSQSKTISDDEEAKPEDICEDIKPMKRARRVESDSSTDCEELELMPTQKIPAKPSNEGDLTDCEDELTGLDTDVDKRDVPTSSPKINFEDLATQVITEDVFDDKLQNNISAILTEQTAKDPGFEDMLTQVIPDDSTISFEELPTQVIDEDITSKSESQTNFSEEMIPSPFKIPLRTPLKMKRKDFLRPSDPKALKPSPVHKISPSNADDEKYYAATQDVLEDLCSQRDQKYYAATQDIFQDLCSQREPSEDANTTPRTVNNNVFKNLDSKLGKDEEVVLRSEHCKASGELSHHDTNRLSKNKFGHEMSLGGSDAEVTKYVSSLSAQQISDVIGVEVTQIKRAPSDPSDVEVTPKKVRPLKFMQTELPDSQEIKTSVSLSSKTPVTESSSESEPENYSEEQTPILFRKKRRAKQNVKQDLTTKFDVSSLPTRIITRKRKPTSKLQESADATMKRSRNILKPKFLSEHDDDVDTEIISENITRLRNKSEKKSNKDISSDSVKLKETNNESNDSNPNVSKHKVTNKPNTRKSKDDETISIDLTELDDIKTERITRKTNDKKTGHDESDKVNNKRKQGRPKTGHKDTSTIDINTKAIEITSKEKDVSKKPRETRNTDKNKKKDNQEKITNYTISKDKVDKSLNSTNETSISTRSTRSKNTDKHSKTIEKKSVSPAPETTKRKRGRPKKEVIVDDKDTTEVRRSKRQKTAVDKSEQPRTSLKHEHSTVYNVSSESSVDSPKGVKRPAFEDIEVRSPKRTRSAASAVLVSSGVSSTSSSRRSTPAAAANKQYVLFTAFPCEEVKGKLEQLGARVVSDVLRCTVVATLQLRRTFKLLCAVGLGRPVVGAAWLQACLDNNAIVDPWQYLLEDEGSERRFGFSLRRTLCGARGFLRRYTVSATPSVLPSAAEMKLIVECSGGTWRGVEPTAEPAPARGSWVVVSCAADRAHWAPLRAAGASLVTSEFILAGVLRQQADLDTTALV